MNLTSYLTSRPQDSFPSSGKVNYGKRYEDISAHLNAHVHPKVMEGALAAQLTRLAELSATHAPDDQVKREIISNTAWLTDHGPQHIETVIARASALAMKGNECALCPYEVYLLLTAIQFHDVGNVFGRDEHEKQISRVMMDMGQLLGSDSSENRLISNIASAHGGTVNGSKDTISRLPAVTKIERDIHIRPQLLAAVLRFADEIAEDRSRAFPLASAQGLITKSSEVFHAYADRLGRVYVGDNSVSLKFEIDLSLITKLFGKGDKEVYLIDEILNRSYKMHLERLYCMRYMRPYINIFSIEVEIGVYTDKYYTEKDKIRYVLEESGYPEDDQDRLYARTHLVTHQGKPMNGPNLIEDLRSRSILI